MYQDARCSSIEKDCLRRQSFVAWLRHNADQYLAQMPYKLAKTYVSDNTTFCAFVADKSDPDRLYDTLCMPAMLHALGHYNGVQTLVAVNLLLYFALLAGFVLAVRHVSTPEQALPYLIVAIGTAVLLLAGHGETRFHIPFMPYIITACSCLLTRNAHEDTVVR